MENHMEIVKMENYASFILEAKKSLRFLEAALEDKQYKEAKEHALNLLAEARLLTQIIKGLH